MIMELYQVTVNSINFLTLLLTTAIAGAEEGLMRKWFAMQ